MFIYAGKNRYQGQILREIEALCIFRMSRYGSLFVVDFAWLSLGKQQIPVLMSTYHFSKRLLAENQGKMSRDSLH